MNHERDITFLKGTQGPLLRDSNRIISTLTMATDPATRLGLGSLVCACKAASRAYGRLMPVLNAPLRVETKLRVFKAMVEPVLFYACETWPLTLRREQRLTSHWFRLIRQIVNCRWPYGERMKSPHPSPPRPCAPPRGRTAQGSIYPPGNGVFR